MKEHLIFISAFSLCWWFYIVAYYTIQQKEIYPIGLGADDIETEFSEATSGVRNKLMDDMELEDLKVKLTILMETAKPYLERS